MADQAPEFVDLESAARAVIAIMKNVPQLANTKIAVIGGLALWKYLPLGRRTEDVDFIITASGAPKAVKDKLLALPNSPFEDRAGIFFYKHPNGKMIQIDITPYGQSPFLPPAASSISNIPSNALPYISPVDLVCFKINCCGLRPTQIKKQRDANDAALLLSSIAQNGPLRLNEAQRKAALDGLDDVVSQTGQPLPWWKQRLGL